MLSLFRRNLLVNYLWLFVFTAACFSFYIINPSNITTGPSNAFLNAVFHVNWPGDQSPYIELATGFILVYISALLVSNLVIQNRMSRALSIVPGGIMVLFSMWCLFDQSLNAILLANIFFILSVSSLFALYKKYKPIATTFNAGFFMGLAALIYQPYLLFILALFLGQISLRSLKVQELLQVLFAFFTPFFLFGVSLYYNQSFDIFWSFVQPNFTMPDIDFSQSIVIVKLGVVALVILYLLLLNAHLLKKKKFDAIKKIELCYWFMFLGFASVFFNIVQDSSHLLVLSLPISVLAGLYLEEKDNSITKEFVFILLTALYFAMLFRLF